MTAMPSHPPRSSIINQLNRRIPLALSLPERTCYGITVMFKNELIIPSGESGYSYTYTIYRSVTANGFCRKNFQVGDLLVLLVDQPTIRGDYPLAGVVEV